VRTRELARVGLTLYSETFPSGMEAHVLPLPGYQKAHATLSAHYGSLDSHFVTPEGREVEVPAGIAHFLEHKLFESKDGSVMDRFSELGAFSNAYTNFTSTTYLFSATWEIEACLTLLMDFVQSARFTPESVAKEQGIIGQELRMYEDNPAWRVFHNLLEGLYARHPVRIDIGGTQESIREITPELLDICYRTFYHPSNLVFFAAGNLDPERTLHIVGEHIKGGAPRGPIQRLSPDEPREALEGRKEARMPVGVPLFEVGWKDGGVGGDLRKEIATSLMLETFIGRSTPLYQDLYAKGLLTDRFAPGYFSGPDFGVVLMGSDTQDVKGLETALLKAVDTARRSGLDEEIFRRCQRREIGETLALFDDPESVAHAFTDMVHKGQDLFEMLDLLGTISMDEVRERLSLLGEENRTVSVVLPREG